MEREAGTSVLVKIGVETLPPGSNDGNSSWWWLCHEPMGRTLDMMKQEPFSTHVRVSTPDGARQLVEVSTPLPEALAPGDMVLMPFNGTAQLFILADKQWSLRPEGWVVEFSVELAQSGAAGDYSECRRRILSRNGWI